jgi:GNAT superfamily N-acetyltransferase
MVDKSRIVIRFASADDAPVLARMRAAMWEEINPDRRADEQFVEQLAAYWRQMLATELATGWVAEADQRIVGTAMLLLHEHPGRPGVESLKRGYVTSVFVAPEARYQGLARRLMDTLIDWAREHGLQWLELRSSTMARKLYEQIGFEPAEFLVLRLE